jgi:hypothetical protein
MQLKDPMNSLLRDEFEDSLYQEQIEGLIEGQIDW